MPSTPFDSFHGSVLPMEIQRQRVHRIIREVLSPIQREVLLAYYIEGLTIPEIALRRCVNKTSIMRALRRAEQKLKHHLNY